jgi:hypothetical protein
MLSAKVFVTGFTRTPIHPHIAGTEDWVLLATITKLRPWTPKDGDSDMMAAIMAAFTHVDMMRRL